MQPMIKTSQIGDYLIITPIVNNINTPIRNEIINYFQKGYKKILLNFINIESLDSLSLGLMINIYTKIKEFNVILKLIGVNHKIMNILRQARLDLIFPVIDSENFPLKCPFCTEDYKNCSHNEELFEKQIEFKDFKIEEEAEKNTTSIDKIVKIFTGKLDTTPVSNRLIKRTRLSTAELEDVSEKLKQFNSSEHIYNKLELITRASTMKILITALIWSLVIGWGSIGIYIYISKGGRTIKNSNTVEKKINFEELSQYVDENYDRNKDGKFTSEDWWLLTPSERLKLFNMARNNKNKQ